LPTPRPEDAGRRVARLNRADMQRLGVHDGQAVEMIGCRHTATIAMPPYPEDEGLSLIRMLSTSWPSPGAMTTSGRGAFTA